MAPRPNDDEAQGKDADDSPTEKKADPDQPPPSPRPDKAERTTLNDDGEETPYVPYGAGSVQKRKLRTAKVFAALSDEDQRMLYQLATSQTKIAETLVPWMHENLPASYFRQCPWTTRLSHLRAIAALQAGDSDPNLTLRDDRDENHYDVTVIRGAHYKGMLADVLVTELQPADGNLRNVSVFTSKDDSVTIFVFHYGTEADEPMATMEDGAHVLDHCRMIRDGPNGYQGLEDSPIYSDEAMEIYFSRCKSKYVRNSSAHRFLVQRMLYARVQGTDSVAVHWENGPVLKSGNEDSKADSSEADPAADSKDDEEKGEPQQQKGLWLTIAASNVLPKHLLEKLTRYLTTKDLEAERVHLDIVSDPEISMPGWDGSVTMLRVVVQPTTKATTALFAVQDAEFLESLASDIRRLKWLDDYTAELAATRGKSQVVGVVRAEVITALATMSVAPLGKVDAFTFNLPNILSTVKDNFTLDIAIEIADLFLARFKPAPNTMLEEEQQQVADRLNARIDGMGNPVVRTLCAQLLRATLKTLKTNVYMPNRYALSLRIDPMAMFTETEKRPEIPFGVFFVHGRRFNGYHNRFRDIARGGIRIVAPRNLEAHSIEAGRHYDECFNLSFAQQLKNKDIPEGGSKGVILVELEGLSSLSKGHAMRNAFKGYAESLLDLIVDTSESCANIVDYFGRPELLYLGPDELIIPEDIVWAIKRARLRGHPIPNSFMSSKPGAGINHKEFGVTSEGVNVYLDVALRRLSNINPKTDPFTVKITGGPDGDVAGNMINILHRDYGDNVKIVGIADGTGSGEDPNGLNIHELIRLFRAGDAIDQFDRSLLSPEGHIYTVDTEEGVSKRNTMHNRVKCDAFIPAGGRPFTVNDDNWDQFMDENNVPSAPLVVEGANLFFTEKARSQLYEVAGVSFIKDSSANKGGVITSSYEIACAMLLSHEEFMDNKPQIVADTLVNLRLAAKNEGELLVDEFKQYPGQLPYFSKAISKQINRVSDNVTAALAGMNRGDEQWQSLMPLLHDHFPRIIIDKWVDRLDERLPEQYVRQAIAANLAARMVYEQGVKFVEDMEDDRIFPVALRYVKLQKEVNQYFQAVEGSDLSGETKDTVMDIVRSAGVRSLLFEGEI